MQITISVLCNNVHYARIALTCMSVNRGCIKHHGYFAKNLLRICLHGKMNGETHEAANWGFWFNIKTLSYQYTTRTRWRRVKTLGQHQVGVNLQSHAQHQLWISTWHIFHEFHKTMPSLSYPVNLVNQNVILLNISHWRLHMAWIMSLMST